MYSPNYVLFLHFNKHYYYNQYSYSAILCTGIPSNHFIDRKTLENVTLMKTRKIAFKIGHESLWMISKSDRDLQGRRTWLAVGDQGKVCCSVDQGRFPQSMIQGRFPHCHS